MLIKLLINCDKEASEIIKPYVEARIATKIICDLIKKNLGTIESIDNDISKHEAQIKLLNKKKVALLKRSSKRATDVDYNLKDKPRREFWKETVKVLDRRPAFITGRNKLYNSKFCESMNLTQFKSLYLKIKKKGDIIG